MKFINNRKGRQFFKRCPLRKIFTILLLFVFINILIYLFWNHYNPLIKGVITLKTLQDLNNDATGNHDLENSTDINYQYGLQNKYYTSENVSSMPCSQQPRHLVGRFVPDLLVYHWHILEAKHPDIDQGHWNPPCRQNQRVAIIIPYRNRGKHVKILVNNLHTFLQRQNQDYGIFVVEQIAGSSFNRAMLFNIGFKESLKWYNFNCFVFHDVDLIPENDFNLYQCGKNPIHLSAYIDKFRYKLPYADLFGGVCALNIKQFVHINGFSNFYFGWGGEDDDMSERLRHHGYTIFRYPKMVGAYKMIKHNGDSGNDANTWRFALVKSAVSRMKKDGLNSLHYTLVDTISNKLTVWFKVQINEESVKRNYSIWINQSFFDADFNYQLRIVIIVLTLFFGCLMIMCFVVLCAIKVTPDLYQPLLSNRVLILERTQLVPRK